jgi:hypothetical protein
LLLLVTLFRQWSAGGVKVIADGAVGYTEIGGDRLRTVAGIEAPLNLVDIDR